VYSDYRSPLTLLADCSDTETGPGVFETALAYNNAVRMADNAILFKYLAKSIGMKHGVLPSFMAKPWNNVSGAQYSFSGLHFSNIHCPYFGCSFPDAAG
jgi:glutamine synthetase